MELLAIICLALIGALVYVVRRSAEDRKEWALERGALLQRIQAPQVAVADFAASPAENDELQYAHFEDDEHFESS